MWRKNVSINHYSKISSLIPSTGTHRITEGMEQVIFKAQAQSSLRRWQKIEIWPDEDIQRKDSNSEKKNLRRFWAQPATLLPCRGRPEESIPRSQHNFHVVRSATTDKLSVSSDADTYDAYARSALQSRAKSWLQFQAMQSNIGRIRNHSKTAIVPIYQCITRSGQCEWLTLQSWLVFDWRHSQTSVSRNNEKPFH